MGATTIPEGWGPKPGHFALGGELGFDRARVQLEADNFADRSAAKGLTYIDWDAAFRTALRNAKKWQDERAPSVPFRASRGPSTGHDFVQDEARSLDSDHWPEATLTPPHQPIPPPPRPPPRVPTERERELAKLPPHELERLMNTAGGFHGWGA